MFSYKSVRTIFLPFIIIGIIFLLKASFSHAADADTEAVIKRRQQLEEELKNLESQIENFRSTIEEKQREATTLERDISILDAQIGKADLEIKARDLSIRTLGESIQGRTQLIDILVKKIENEKNSLAELLRRVNELDSSPLIEIVVEYDRLSDFFADIDNFESIQKSVQDSVDKIRLTKTTTEKEKEDLENKKAEEMELRSLQVLEKKRKQEAENEKKQLLKLTKGKEKEYQELLASRQKNAANIRSQLFILRGSPAIPFEKAFEYASGVSKITGIRPAYLLGVISEESNLGANVGTGNWREELSNYRCVKQKEAFVEITASLGLDPDLMPISRKAWYGYCGGAMGPAQFIPTTWKLYSERIANITKHSPPSPWDPYDAFAGAALLLKDNGAISGNYTSERNAALKYLAGSNWRKSSYSFYGDDVMALATKYQELINILQ